MESSAHQLKYLPDPYLHLGQLLKEGKKIARAVVISRTGSGPREAGATMFIASDGCAAGTVGGGLLEARVMETAREVVRSGKAAVEPFALDDEMAAEEGMICGGTMEVLIHPLQPADPGASAVFSRLLENLQEGHSLWLFTSIQRIDDDIKTGVGLLSPGEADPGTLPVQVEEMESLAQACGDGATMLTGECEKRFFIQPVRLPEPFFLFGAGHISEALAPLCRQVGFHPVVVDDRAKFADPQRFPEAGQVLLVDSFEGCFENLEIDKNSFIAVVTRGHAHDRAVVSQALRTGARYIGMVGSARKRAAVFEALLEEGFVLSDLQRIHSPIGLPIGALTPAEIAVSIVAEMIAVRAGKKVRHLKWRDGEK